MTSTSRPWADHTTFGRAAVSVAEQVLDLAQGIRAEGESREAARDRLVAAILMERDKLRTGGQAMATAVARRVGFTSNLYVAEIFEDFPGEISKVVAGDIRAWVERERPAPPFTARFARVTLAQDEVGPGGRRGEAPSGVAMRTRDHDASAYLAFIPDAEKATFIRAKGSRGASIVTWENVATVSPLQGSDAEVVSVALEREARLERVSTLGQTKSAAATERRAGADGCKRILTGDPEARGQILLEMLDAAGDALRAGDEDTARAALAELGGALNGLRMHEADNPRVTLTDGTGVSRRP